MTVIDSVTGDPVADCQAAWRDLGLEPPALAAYDNGRGGIEVLPADTAPQTGWTPLDPGVVQDPRLLQLDAALNDHGAGLPSACHQLSPARAIAERELDRLGLEGWTIRADRGEADGTTTCTYYYLDPSQREVVLIPMEGIAPSGPFAGYARGLADALDDACLSVPQAARAARDLAVDAGIADMGLVIHEVVDESFDCARSDVNVGGRIEVIIRGPATTS